MQAKSARYSIRKAAKLGVVVEEARDEQFADDYYAQLREVFAGQGLVPTYGKERTLLLMRHLLPTGNLLLLRARAPDGRCIATGIFLGMNRRAYFWGNASWRKDRHFCPNEALHWYAMQLLEAARHGVLRHVRRRPVQTEIRMPAVPELFPLEIAVPAGSALARRAGEKSFQVQQRLEGRFRRRQFFPKNVAQPGGDRMSRSVAWPEGKRFAFSVFDDTDGATVENVGSVYAFLGDCGLRHHEVLLGVRRRSAPRQVSRTNAGRRPLPPVAPGFAGQGF